ncbi:MAG: CDP-paratose 2-epimerase [Myxococcales bacterium]|nr:MAG: CDP-paratose 2-epimerase [Myxococcales bacterium]
MTMHRLEQTQLVPAPLSRVFDFFSAAENLQRLTPPFLSFRILTALPIEMKTGQHIEYQIKLGGVPMRWLTEIREWQPGERFVDVQLRGPYRTWHHLHEFREVSGGTEMRDVVDYELPFGPLGDLVHALAVKRTLSRIFAFRRQAVDTAFPAP